MFKKFLGIMAICLIVFFSNGGFLFADETTPSHINHRVKAVPRYGEGVKKIDYEEFKKLMERANLTPKQLKELEEKEKLEQQKKQEEDAKIKDGNLVEDKLSEELKSFKPPYSLEQLEKFRAHVDVIAQAKEISIKLLEKEHEDVLELAKFNNYEGGDRVTAIKRNKKKNIDPLISKSKLEHEKRGLKFHSYKSFVELEKLVSDYQLSLLEKEFLNQKYEYIKSVYEADQLKFKLGKLLQIDLSESENKLNEVKDSLSMQEDMISALLNELKRKTGFQLEDEFSLDYKIMMKKEVPSYLKDRISSSVKNQAEWLEKQEKVEYTKLIFEDVRTFYKSHDKEYISSEADYKIALMEYNDTYNSLLIDFNHEYKKMENQLRFCRLTKENLDLKLKNYESKKIEYSLGKISKLDLDYAKLDYLQAQLNLQKEIANFNYQRDMLYMKLRISYR